MKSVVCVMAFHQGGPGSVPRHYQNVKNFSDNNIVFLVITAVPKICNISFTGILSDKHMPVLKQLAQP